MNNILILFLKDSPKKCYSFPLETRESEAVGMALDEENKHLYIKHKYIQNAEHPLDYYHNYYEEGQEKVDLKKIIISKKINQIKEYRNAFLESLDMAFMRSLESEDPSVKNHIVKLKTHLRNLPQNLKFNKISEEADILRYNPFNNITQLILIVPGNHYTAPPAIRIAPPEGKYYGFSPKATCFIKDGRVVKIETTDFGCGYDAPPKVEIDPPKDKDGNPILESAAQAICAPIELPIDF